MVGSKEILQKFAAYILGLLFSTYALQPSKAYCAIWVRRSNFRPLGVSTHVTTREHLATKDGTVGEKCPVIFA